MGYIQDLRKVIGTQPIIMVGACVIVRNAEDQILFQQRADTFDWGLPGGAMELGETLEEVAKRELYEETGLTLQTMQLLTILSGKEMYYQFPHGDEVYNVTGVFEALEVEGELKINDEESLELRFLSVNEAKDNLNLTAAKILKSIGYL